jgi:ABC-type oligopeptide transport system substrate-binding subunit
MKRFRSRIVGLLVIAAIAVVALAGCGSKAGTVAHNLSVASDNFQVPRTITAIDTQTGQILYVVKGLCSLGESDNSGASQNAPVNGQALTTTCDLQKKNAQGQELYAKNYFGTSWQLTWTATQNTGVAVSDTHYQFILRPSTLIPGVNVQ